MAPVPALTVPQLATLLGQWPPPTVVDVRRAAAFERDPVRIPGAIRRLPDEVAAWSRNLEPWRAVVVYCVHGHEVSQDAASALRDTGLNARYLTDGIEGWKAADKYIAEQGYVIPLLQYVQPVVYKADLKVVANTSGALQPTLVSNV